MADAARAPLNEARASFLSEVTFSWAFPLLRLGATRPLEAADLGAAAACDRSVARRTRSTSAPTSAASAAAGTA